MGKIEAIEKVTKIAEQLTEEELQAVVDFSTYMLGPSVYSALDDASKASIDRGLADRAAGRTLGAEEAHKAIRDRLSAARK